MGVMSVSEQPTLVIRTDQDRIAVITLDSPANRNALSAALVTQLTAHITQAGTDTDLHGILLRSSGRVFCAGVDLREAMTVDMVAAGRGIVALQRAIAAADVPVVCRVDGPVRAGGLGIVASADLVLAASEADFALTEVRLGLAAAIISVPVLGRLTPRAAADWFLTGRTVSAQEAVRAGLVTRVEPAGGDLDAAVDAVLTDLRAGERQGLVEAKRMLAAGLVADLDARGDDLAELSGRLFHSEVAQGHFARFLAR